MSGEEKGKNPGGDSQKVKRVKGKSLKLKVISCKLWPVCSYSPGRGKIVDLGWFDFAHHRFGIAD